MSLPSSHEDLTRPDTTKLASRIAILGPASIQIAFFLELTLVPVLLPSIQADFGLSLGELAWVFNAYSIAMAVGILACAAGGDSFKSTKVFGFGVLFFLAGTALIYVATSNSVLTLGRVCQGFGAGLFSPLIPVLLTQATPDRPGRTLILWGSTAGYVAAFAPLVYGFFLDDENWSLAFLLIALVAALSLFSLTTTPTRTRASASDGRKSSYNALLGSQELWLTLAYVFTTYGAITYFLFRVPLWLAEAGRDTASIGVVMSVLWLSFSTLSALLRNWVDSNGLRPIMVAAPVLIALGLILALTGNELLLIASACLVGCGLACSNAPSTQLVLRFAPKGLTALATSLDITVARLGGIVTVTFLADAGWGVSACAILISCFFAVAFAFLIVNRSLEAV
ncbi:MAG: MFS transporter [Pseudomonadota bacterium]